MLYPQPDGPHSDECSVIAPVGEQDVWLGPGGHVGRIALPVADLPAAQPDGDVG